MKNHRIVFRSDFEKTALSGSNIQHSVLRNAILVLTKGLGGPLLFLLLQMSFVLKFITTQRSLRSMYDTSQIAFEMRSKGIGLI